MLVPDGLTIAELGRSASRCDHRLGERLAEQADR
jgi:hypothetical protein